MSVKEQDEYSRKKEGWDQDADMLTDYFERGMLLDATKADTDNDGVVDGNDRNPRCAPSKEKTEAQGIAQFLFYLYTRRGSARSGPFPFTAWIVSTVDDYDGKGRPSTFDGLELTGVDGIVLHMSPDDVKRYRSIHGYGTPIINIHEATSTGQSLREFHFSEYIAPEGAVGWRIRVKRVNGIWLPVEWEMTWIS